MSRELVPFEDERRLPARIARQVRRDRAVAQASGAIVTARETAKIEAIGDITRNALIEASQISALEAVLVSRTPHAEARLRHIADSGVAAIGDVVLRAGRRFS